MVSPLVSALPPECRDDRPRFLRNAARKIIFAEAFRMPARISRYDVGPAAVHGLQKNLPALSS
jgi:hypothetical protein